MTAEHPKVLVLRHPEHQGNYTYWMVELPSGQDHHWRDRLARGESAANEFGDNFGQPLTLNEVMERLKSRDFQVLDYPGAMAH